AFRDLLSRREWTTFGKNLQGTNRVVDAVEPAVGGVRFALCHPYMGSFDVLLRGDFDDDVPPLHFLRRGILCLARISSSAWRNGLPVPAFIPSRPRWMPRMASSVSS